MLMSRFSVDRPNEIELRALVDRYYKLTANLYTVLDDRMRTAGKSTRSQLLPYVSHVQELLSNCEGAISAGDYREAIKLTKRIDLFLIELWLRLRGEERT